METTIVYWGFIGILEKKMEATTVFFQENHAASRFADFTLSPSPGQRLPKAASDTLAFKGFVWVCLEIT